MERLTDKQRQAARQLAETVIETCEGFTTAENDNIGTAWKYAVSLAEALLDDGWTAVEDGLPDKCEKKEAAIEIKGPGLLNYYNEFATYEPDTTVWCRNGKPVEKKSTKLSVKVIAWKDCTPFPAPPEPDDE